MHITGTVLGDSERRRVETLLRTIPHAPLLSFELQLVDVDAVAPLAASPSPPPPGERSHAAAAEAWLRARMGVGTRASERDMFSRMSTLVSSAEDVLADAWAIDHLAAQFPLAKQELLSASALDLLTAVMNDHAHSAARRLSRIDTLLSLASPAAPAIALTPGDWQHRAPEFRKAAQRFSDLMLRLFAGAGPAAAPPANPEHAGLPELLRQLQSQAAQIASR